MASQTKDILKSYFETGDKPTQQQFADLIDSMFNKTDDMLSGAKTSAVDAGILWQMSIEDDYIYICVKTGTAGNAIWKKALLFAT